MPTTKAEGYATQIRRLVALVGARYESGPDAAEQDRLDFAVQLIDRAHASVQGGDPDSAWMHLIGALNFLKMTRLNKRELDDVRARIDWLIEH